MSPYWVCVVLRGGVESEIMSVWKCHKPDLPNYHFHCYTEQNSRSFSDAVNLEHWLGWPGSVRSAARVSQSSCSLLNCSAVSAARGPPRDCSHYGRGFLFQISRVGRVGMSRNHLLTEVPVIWTGCFNTCLFLRWEGSEERAAVELCREPTHSQPLPAGGTATVLLWCDSSHPLFQLLSCNWRNPSLRFSCRTWHCAYTCIPSKEKDV